VGLALVLYLAGVATTTFFLFISSYIYLAVDCNQGGPK
jgi:hypothetical protein